MRITTIALSILLAVPTCAGTETTEALTVAHDDAGKTQAASKPVSCIHKAPRSECFICDAKLREKGRLWCNEHERYEDRCWICHPEAQDKQRLFCKEHSLYEDECFLCHPELKKKRDKPSGSPVPSTRKDDNSR